MCEAVSIFVNDVFAVVVGVFMCVLKGFNIKYLNAYRFQYFSHTHTHPLTCSYVSL